MHSSIRRRISRAPARVASPPRAPPTPERVSLCLAAHGSNSGSRSSIARSAASPYAILSAGEVAIHNPAGGRAPAAAGGVRSQRIECRGAGDFAGCRLCPAASTPCAAPRVLSVHSSRSCSAARSAGAITQRSAPRRSGLRSLLVPTPAAPHSSLPILTTVF